MSRNFELLQQLGKGGELFKSHKPPRVSVARPAPPPAPVAVALPLQNEVKAPAENHRGPLKGEAPASAEELKLAHHLLTLSATGQGSVVMFSGVGDDLGCTSICARSAPLLAEQSRAPVCLVDANLASPSLHQFFGVENRMGLADALCSQARLRDSAQRLSQENLWLIPAGTWTPSDNGLLASAALRSSIDDLRQAFTHIIVCAPSVTHNPDSLLIGQLMDGVFLVLEAETTRREAAKRAKADLEATDARVLGVVLNNRKFHIPEPIYRML